MKNISLGLCTIVLSLLCVTITESTFASTNNTVSGNVKNINNLPIESVRLSLKGERTRMRKETISDENGSFEFTGIEPDSYKLMVKRKGHMKLQQTVDVEEGENNEVEIIMEYDVTGNWKGYFETNIIPHTDIYLKLRQSNTNITGSMTGQGGITGEFNGTIDGNAIEFELKKTMPVCPNKYSGTAMLSDDSSEIELSTMTGRDCIGEQKDGYGFVTRQ